MAWLVIISYEEPWIILKNAGGSILCIASHSGRSIGARSPILVVTDHDMFRRVEPQP